MADKGILAIFNDCAAGREAEFEEWFQGEHLQERLAVPGFLFGRRHQAISGSAGYFNFYLVESPAVLTSKLYLERLDRSDADDAEGDVGDFHQHEPHGLSSHAAVGAFAAPMPSPRASMTCRTSAA